jgi:GNAT superfamily N-acetyltransferase
VTTPRVRASSRRSSVSINRVGVPVAGLSGYAIGDTSLDPTDIALRDAARIAGWSDLELVQSFERLSVFLGCLPEDVPDAWVVEWVAARPQVRRQGLVNALLGAILDRGKRRGHSVAQIGILIGNTPAQRAYEKVGFWPAQERRHPDFEATLGCPGLMGLRRVL